MQKPYLIIVTGQPGSGKTTLAHRLAAAIHCPALCRDEFKEGYIHTAGRGHSEIPGVNGLLYDKFFGAVDLLVQEGISHVAEAAFQHKLWAPKLEPLLPQTRMRIIVCQVDVAVARLRFIRRAQADPLREHFHGDGVAGQPEEEIELPLRDYTPPDMPVPTQMVDSTDGYRPSLQELVSWAL